MSNDKLFLFWIIAVMIMADLMPESCYSIRSSLATTIRPII